MDPPERWTQAAAMRAFLAWLVILAFAIANGALREIVLAPRLDATTAQLVSGALLILGIFAVSFVLVPGLHATSRGQLLRVGVCWMVLTLAFEIAFGRLQGRSAAELLAAYTFRGGNLWPLVLVATLLAPLLVGGRRARP
jgi:hypothetical protein